MMGKEFNKFCLENIGVIRELKISPVITGSNKEAVLFTYSAEPYLEFLIRCAIIHLGADWSHTVVCGNSNVAIITQICSKIDANIRIINTGYSSLSPLEHDRFITSKAFWKLFRGSNILMYQEDCCVFGEIPESLLRLDLIISGGLSIRNRDTMLRCIYTGIGKFRAQRESDFFTIALLQAGGRLPTSDEVGLFDKCARFYLTDTSESWKNTLVPLLNRIDIFVDFTETVVETKIHAIKPILPPDISQRYRVYILCHNSERLKSAEKIYAKYPWAVPIQMKYQDYTFENAFWRQLLEIQDEWFHLDFVGTISWSAHRKINMGLIHKHVMGGYYSNRDYVHFADTGTPVRKSSAPHFHPNFLKIWDDVTKSMGIDDVTDNHYNYWMCRPALMEGFIRWYTEICAPLVVKHPLAFSDSKYGGSLNSEKLFELCSVPYYPHVPFIIERLNKAFFDNTERDWFLDKIDIIENSGNFIIRPMTLLESPPENYEIFPDSVTDTRKDESVGFDTDS